MAKKARAAELAAADQEATTALTPEELETRREWYRKYRAANPEKVRRWEKNRWKKKTLQRAGEEAEQQQGAGK